MQKTILIAEDEAAMLKALSQKIENRGFKVSRASDGEEALSLIAENKFDLVMLDILMPKLDGLTVMKKIREDEKWGKYVPIIMLTNLSDSASMEEANEFNVDFLVKTDWRLDDVVAFISNKLGINN
ncbi:response regulator [Candidatus Parcubacteria bacterium]|nr:response regulator [Candidatus Parcubacteria bacterium]